MQSSQYRNWKLVYTCPCAVSATAGAMAKSASCTKTIPIPNQETKILINSLCKFSHYQTVPLPLHPWPRLPDLENRCSNLWCDAMFQENLFFPNKGYHQSHSFPHFGCKNQCFKCSIWGKGCNLWIRTAYRSKKSCHRASHSNFQLPRNLKLS